MNLKNPCTTTKSIHHLRTTGIRIDQTWNRHDLLLVTPPSQETSPMDNLARKASTPNIHNWTRIITLDLPLRTPGIFLIQSPTIPLRTAIAHAWYQCPHFVSIDLVQNEMNNLSYMRLKQPTFTVPCSNLVFSTPCNHLVSIMKLSLSRLSSNPLYALYQIGRQRK